MKRLALLVVVLVQVFATGAAFAQSLADVARREEARRREVKKPARVYTNKDLGASDAGSRPAPAAAPPGADASAAPGETPATGTQAAPAPDAPAGPTEEEQREAAKEQWQSRMSAARDQLERSKMFAEALQTRANSLWADFTARDDPAQRSVIESDRKKTLAEIDRVKGEIEAQTKALADLEEEARRAGVPPGWLR